MDLPADGDPAGGYIPFIIPRRSQVNRIPWIQATDETTRSRASRFNHATMLNSPQDVGLIHMLAPKRTPAKKTNVINKFFALFVFLELSERHSAAGLRRQGHGATTRKDHAWAGSRSELPSRQRETDGRAHVVRRRLF